MTLGKHMSIADMVQKMIDDLNETMADAVKSDKGNNAAMTRVRKAMQAAKGAAQDRLDLRDLVSPSHRFYRTGGEVAQRVSQVNVPLD